MEMRLASLGGALSKALDTQSLAPQLISETLTKVSEIQKAVPSAGISAEAQKAILSSAYADLGKGTRINTVV